MFRKANAVIEDLVWGNTRFVEGKSIKSSAASLKKLKDFSEKGQIPKAIVLCCSDSRAPVEMIFDQDIGDLFVIRVAGNIVAPSLVGSVEFAASTFGTELVLVMGHSQCGAVDAIWSISKIARFLFQKTSMTLSAALNHISMP